MTFKQIHVWYNATHIQSHNNETAIKVNRLLRSGSHRRRGSTKPGPTTRPTPTAPSAGQWAIATMVRENAHAGMAGRVQPASAWSAQTTARETGLACPCIAWRSCGGRTALTTRSSTEFPILCDPSGRAFMRSLKPGIMT